MGLDQSRDHRILLLAQWFQIGIGILLEAERTEVHAVNMRGLEDADWKRQRCAILQEDPPNNQILNLQPTRSPAFPEDVHGPPLPRDGEYDVVWVQSVIISLSYIHCLPSHPIITYNWLNGNTWQFQAPSASPPRLGGGWARQQTREDGGGYPVLRGGITWILFPFKWPICIK